MIDLSKVGGKGLPETIEVYGESFSIKTDFQYYITFSRMTKEQHQIDDFDMFYSGKTPRFKHMALVELSKFAFPVNELPRNAEPNEEILIDYEKDSDLIYSAFYHYYNIDLMDPALHLHWHKFLALFNGIKDTKLNDIMSFRGYEPSASDSKEYKTQMLKLKSMWKIEPVIPDNIMSEIEEWERKNNIK